MKAINGAATGGGPAARGKFDLRTVIDVLCGQRRRDDLAGVGIQGRWCVNRTVDVLRQLVLSSGDALGHWHAQAIHLVQHRAADPGLGLLGGQTPGAKTGTDQGFIPELGLPRLGYRWRTRLAHRSTRSIAAADHPQPQQSGAVRMPGSVNKWPTLNSTADQPRAGRAPSWRGDGALHCRPAGGAPSPPSVAA